MLMPENQSTQRSSEGLFILNYVTLYKVTWCRLRGRDVQTDRWLQRRALARLRHVLCQPSMPGVPSKSSVTGLQPGLQHAVRRRLDQFC